MLPSAKNIENTIKTFGAIKTADPEDYKKISDRVFNETIIWQKNTEKYANIFPLVATVNSQPWKLRINNFPDEPMYTLFIGPQAVITFDDLPKTWTIKSK